MRAMDVEDEKKRKCWRGLTRMRSCYAVLLPCGAVLCYVMLCYAFPFRLTDELPAAFKWIKYPVNFRA